MRDHLLLMMMYQHGLRVTEAIKLRCKDVNLKRACAIRVVTPLRTRAPTCAQCRITWATETPP